ncbi:inositol polyphosphate 1-phosphatase [Drosophila grimshawi]|uniref:GH14420 n=1 Tax=Drosophila grimshawi TaxID=7222 RepID=B4JV46_DROGR|nr:inositol polyphosphate 1-phosphatase [Drosophila grimshawi]EDV91366.1 GH14420 [Drosophila grimshawi]
MSQNINLLRVLINCGEKAANIARVCRSNEELLALLVQEKTGSEANQRFEHDFKTLADVLIQETVKHEVGQLFPAMRDSILGEESTHFTNKLGHQITIAIGVTEAETAECLESVLDGQKTAAEALAAEVHMRVSIDTKLTGIPELCEQLDYSNLGIWIDPIDATAEYISGASILSDKPDIAAAGLDCVTVLIGVYERDSGVPVIGVVLQPFGYKLGEHDYSSSLYWGVCLPTLQAHNCSFEASDGQDKIGIVSGSEKSDIVQRLVDLDYDLVVAAGAGYKALKVISNDAEVYLLSKGSTFRWDTCAPQAILRALGGDIFDYADSIKQQLPVALKYKDPDTDSKECGTEWKRNANGLIAVRDLSVIKELLSNFKEN